MLNGIARGLIVTAAGLWLAGCSTPNSLSDLYGAKPPSDDAQSATAAAEPEQPGDEPTGTVPAPLGVKAVSGPGLL
ncbi:MAG: hypothetical protein WCF66_07965, partial [Pseudolabrys sp.]